MSRRVRSAPARARCRATRSATLPNTTCASPVCPRVPSATRSAPSSAARAQIAPDGSSVENVLPTRTIARAQRAGERVELLRSLAARVVDHAGAMAERDRRQRLGRDVRRGEQLELGAEELGQLERVRRVRGRREARSRSRPESASLGLPCAAASLHDQRLAARADAPPRPAGPRCPRSRRTPRKCTPRAGRRRSPRTARSGRSGSRSRGPARSPTPRLRARCARRSRRAGSTPRRARPSAAWSRDQAHAARSTPTGRRRGATRSAGNSDSSRPRSSSSRACASVGSAFVRARARASCDEPGAQVEARGSAARRCARRTSSSAACARARSRCTRTLTTQIGEQLAVQVERRRAGSPGPRCALSQSASAASNWRVATSSRTRSTGSSCLQLGHVGELLRQREVARLGQPRVAGDTVRGQLRDGELRLGVVAAREVPAARRRCRARATARSRRSRRRACRYASRRRALGGERLQRGLDLRAARRCSRTSRRRARAAAATASASNTLCIVSRSWAASAGLGSAARRRSRHVRSVRSARRPRTRECFAWFPPSSERSP